MANPVYRVRIDSPASVIARTDGMVKFECWVEFDELGDGNWVLVPDANHFEVLLPTATVATIGANALLDTVVKRRKALEAAIIAVDPRLSALRAADDAARRAINWMNLKTGAETWLI